MRFLFSFSIGCSNSHLFLHFLFSLFYLSFLFLSLLHFHCQQTFLFSLLSPSLSSVPFLFLILLHFHFFLFSSSIFPWFRWKWCHPLDRRSSTMKWRRWTTPMRSSRSSRQPSASSRSTAAHVSSVISWCRWRRSTTRPATPPRPSREFKGRWAMVLHARWKVRRKGLGCWRLWGH